MNKLERCERVHELASECLNQLRTKFDAAAVSRQHYRNFDADDLQKLVQRGRDAIRPVQNHFTEAAGSKGVEACGSLAKCTHGLVFEITAAIIARPDRPMEPDSLHTLYSQLGLEIAVVRSGVDKPPFEPPPCPECSGKVRTTSSPPTMRHFKCNDCGHTFKRLK